MYVLFTVVLFLMWAKPVEYVNDYTEVDEQGHILRVNGKPFNVYLAVPLLTHRIMSRRREWIFETSPSRTRITTLRI